MPSKDGIEKRKHPRKTYSDVIKFCVNPRSPNKIFIGVSINISDLGICLYTSDNLRKGEEIVIQEKLPIKYRKATVIWIKHYHREFYKVGLMFHE